MPRTLIPIPDEAAVDAAQEQLATKEKYWVVKAGDKKIAVGTGDLSAKLKKWAGEYRIVVLLDTATVYLGPKDFRFGRGKEAEKLRAQQQQLTAVKQMMTSYQQQEADTQREIARLKALAKNPKAGTSLDEIIAEVKSWPHVIDFLPGPVEDPITKVFLLPGEFVLTLVPTAYQGTDNEAGRGKWAVTNPIRLRIRENGTISGIAGVNAHRDRHNFLTTHHPHMSADSICAGNLTRIYRAVSAANDVLGALYALGEYAVSHGENDYMARHFYIPAWAWWEKFVTDRDFHDLWTFGGKWDGDSIRMNRAESTLVKMSEMFGDVGAAAHVGSIKRYISKGDVEEFTKAMKKGGAPSKCLGCGRGSLGCPCHQNLCPDCGSEFRHCVCPPLSGHPQMVRLIIWRGRVVRLTRNSERGYTCEFINPESGGSCRRDAIYSFDGHFPRYACREHLDKEPLALWKRAEALSKVWAEANDPPGSWRIAPGIETRTLPGGDMYICEYVREGAGPCGARALEGYTRGIENVPRPHFWCREHAPLAPILPVRHDHTHTHRGAGPRGGTIKHTHPHEHPSGVVLTEEVEQHDNNHLAFLAATGMQLTDLSHERIK